MLSMKVQINTTKLYIWHVLQSKHYIKLKVRKRSKVISTMCTATLLWLLFMSTNLGYADLARVFNFEFWLGGSLFCTFWCRRSFFFLVASARNAPLVKHPWLLTHNHTSKRVREIWMKKARCTYFIMAINWPDFPTDFGSCSFLHKANYSLYVCFNEEQVYNAYISPEGADQNNTGDEHQCRCAELNMKWWIVCSPWSP